MGAELPLKKHQGYPLYYIFNQKKSLLIWVDVDGGNAYILSSAQGVIHIANSFREMKKICAEVTDVEIHWDQKSTLDIDRFFAVLDQLQSGKHSNRYACRILLDVWNFLEDLACSADFEKSQYRIEGAAKCYDKIFWGCNLPAVTPEGRVYQPVWCEEEIEAIKQEVGNLMKLISKKQPSVFPVAWH